MRYKLGKMPFLSRTAELGQNQNQQLLYLRHTFATLMEKNEFALFDALAYGYNVWFMMLQDAFELIRLNYKDWTIIVQVTEFQYIIEMRRK